MKKFSSLKKNKKAIILCSGPSASYSKTIDENDVVIVPNRSILLEQIKFCKNIVWIKGTGWQRENVSNWWMELARSSKCKPKCIMLRGSMGTELRFNIVKEDFLKIFSNTKVLPLIEFEYNKISTGMLCIKFALENNFDQIEVYGMEMGVNSKYDLSIINNEANKKALNIPGGSDRDSFTRHLSEDIKYLNSLELKMIEKIQPVKESGLYLFLEKLRKKGK